MSGEGQTGRLDCGIQGVPEPVSKDRLRGIRIFDIADIDDPKYVANVQTCRGSHTHTVVTDPNDKENVYIYVSGLVAACGRRTSCRAARTAPIDDPNTARFRIEVIKVPLAAPQKAAIVSSPRIFNGLAPPPRRDPSRDAAAAGAAAPAWCDGDAAGRRRAGAPAGLPPRSRRCRRRGRCGRRGAAGGRGRGGPAGPPTGPNQCHDITVYPDIGLAGGACGGYGLLLDIREVAHPMRIDAVADIEHVVLALGDLQQRRHEDPVLATSGAAARSRAAARPTSRSGAPTRSSRSRRTR